MRKVFLKEPGVIAAEEIEQIVPEDGWVLIKTRACGICGTDVHSYFGETIFGKVFPFHIGHEVSGTVAAAGKGKGILKEGDTVVIDPFYTCDQCPPCRRGENHNCRHKTTIGLSGPGGFSEYVYVPETSAFKADLDNFESLTLVEPLSTVIYGLRKLTRNSTDNILINGAGPIGQLFLQLLTHENIGSLTVADLNDEKLAIAKKIGADSLYNPASGRTLTELMPDGFDIIIDCTGSPRAVMSSFPALGFGGQFLIFGVCPADSKIELKPFEIYQKDARLMGSFALDRASFQEALDLISRKKIDTSTIIAEVVPLSGLEDAIQRLSRGEINGKVVVDTTLE